MAQFESVPVGSIVAYCGPRPALDKKPWMVCDGRRLQRAQYPELFEMIGTANGGDSVEFQLPDLTGRFIRGESLHDGMRAGSTHDFRTGLTLIFAKNMRNIPSRVGTTAATKGGRQFMDVGRDIESKPITCTSTETRPDNMYMDYIIKVRSRDPKDDLVEDLPIGAVFPFAGSDDVGPTSSTSNHYVLCNGDNVVASQHPELAAALEKRFTADVNQQDAVTPPNLQGLFIRGIDNVGRHDQDFASRKKAHGDHTGVGTTQTWATKLRNPRVVIQALNQDRAASSGCMAAAGTTGITNGDWQMDLTAFGGGDPESRPKNAAVRFYLTAIDARPAHDHKGKQPSNLPVGGIIAIAGTPTPDAEQRLGRYWSLCDGGLRSSELDPELARVLNGAKWTADKTLRSPEGIPLFFAPQKVRIEPAPPGFFRLPDLRGLYLRGLSSGRSTGDFQDWSTGLRKEQLKAVDFGDWPHDEASAARGGGNRVYDASGSRDYFVLADWDYETAPRSAVVRYYVRGSYKEPRPPST